MHPAVRGGARTGAAVHLEVLRRSHHPPFTWAASAPRCPADRAHMGRGLSRHSTTRTHRTTHCRRLRPSHNITPEHSIHTAQLVIHRDSHADTMRTHSTPRAMRSSRSRAMRSSRPWLTTIAISFLRGSLIRTTSVTRRASTRCCHRRSPCPRTGARRRRHRRCRWRCRSNYGCLACRCRHRRRVLARRCLHCRAWVYRRCRGKPTCRRGKPTCRLQRCKPTCSTCSKRGSRWRPPLLAAGGTGRWCRTSPTWGCPDPPAGPRRPCSSPRRRAGSGPPRLCLSGIRASPVAPPSWHRTLSGGACPLYHRGRALAAAAGAGLQSEEMAGHAPRRPGGLRQPWAPRARGSGGGGGGGGRF